MAGHVNTGASAEGRSLAVEEYLHDIEGSIPRWPRARHAVMADIADGLDDTVQHYLDSGETQQQAVARAIEDSGPAPVVAGAITDMLAFTHARFTAITLLLTGPIVGVLWLLNLALGRPPTALLIEQPAVGLLVLIAALFGGLTVLATGRLFDFRIPRSRRYRLPPSDARRPPPVMSRCSRQPAACWPTPPVTSGSLSCSRPQPA